MKRVGPYELLEKVGEDEQAEVWRAHKPLRAGTKKTVDVRLTSPERAARARQLRWLAHDNVLPVLDAGAIEGQGYVVEPWVDGISLARLDQALREHHRPMPLAATVFIVGEVLRGLAYLESRGTTHGELSAQSIVLSASGQVFVRGFGLSAAPKPDLPALATLLGELVGRADVDDPAPELDALRAHLTENADGWMVTDAHARLKRFGGYQECSSLVAELVQLGQASQPRSEMKQVAPQPAKARPSAWILGLAAAGVLALGGGSVALLQSDKPEQAQAVPEPVSENVASPMTQSQPTPPTETVEQTPDPEPPPEPEPEPEPIAEAPTKAEPTTPAAADEPAPEKKKTKGKAKVGFYCGDYRFTWIKVRGKELPLEPRQIIDLPAGKHRVWMRATKEDPWKRAGSITLDPKKYYKVLMKEPGKAKLREVSAKDLE